MADDRRAANDSKPQQANRQPSNEPIDPANVAVAGLPSDRANNAQGTAPADPISHKPPSYTARFGLVYTERASGPIKADVYLPQGKGPFPGVLVVHGGAWCMGSRAQLAGVAAKLAQRGYVAVAISYRLAPDHLFPAQLDDCRAALQWMCAQAPEFGLDRGRIGAFGYSAGAHLVALLATSTQQEAASTDAATSPAKSVESLTTQGRLRAVVAGGAPCDFRSLPLDWRGLAFWLGGSRRQAPDLYTEASPAAFVSPDDPPMFFFHGETDELVPLVSPQSMCEALEAARVPHELYVAPRLGHMAAIFDAVSLEKSFAFLDQRLLGQASHEFQPD